MSLLYSKQGNSSPIWSLRVLRIFYLVPNCNPVCLGEGSSSVCKLPGHALTEDAVLATDATDTHTHHNMGGEGESASRGSRTGGIQRWCSIAGGKGRSRRVISSCRFTEVASDQSRAISWLKPLTSGCTPGFGPDCRR